MENILCVPALPTKGLWGHGGSAGPRLCRRANPKNCQHSNDWLCASGSKTLVSFPGSVGVVSVWGCQQCGVCVCRGQGTPRQLCCSLLWGLLSHLLLLVSLGGDGS